MSTVNEGPQCYVDRMLNPLPGMLPVPARLIRNKEVVFLLKPLPGPLDSEGTSNTKPLARTRQRPGKGRLHRDVTGQERLA